MEIPYQLLRMICFIAYHAGCSELAKHPISSRKVVIKPFAELWKKVPVYKELGFVENARMLIFEFGYHGAGLSKIGHFYSSGETEGKTMVEMSKHYHKVSKELTSILDWELTQFKIGMKDIANAYAVACNE